MHDCEPSECRRVFADPGIKKSVQPTLIEHDPVEEDAEERQQVLSLEGKPKDIAEAILTELGVDKAKRVVRALDKRLGNIKPDCRFCGGDGLTKPKQAYSVCGSIKYEGVFLRIPCSCDEKMAETWATEPGRNREADRKYSRSSPTLSDFS